MLIWLKSLWQLIDGHKRDIAGLYCNSFTSWMALAGIAEHHIIYIIGAIIGNILTAVGWGHAGAKGDFLRK
jgi:hypothetical protein